MHLHCYGYTLYIYFVSHTALLLNSMYYYFTVADLGFWKGGFQCARDWSHKARKRVLDGGVARGDMFPYENFGFQTWDRLWCRCRVKHQELDDQLPNIVAFEAFKPSHNFSASLRRGNKAAVRSGKFFLASYCIRSVVDLLSWEIQTLTVCHLIVNHLLWYSTMVSVGRSVRTYVCTDLLSTREGSPSKGGCICIPLTPHESATASCIYIQPKFIKCLLQSFFSGYTHWLRKEYNYCVFACTERRRECTTALYMSETILSDKVARYIHRLQFYCHATVILLPAFSLEACTL